MASPVASILQAINPPSAFRQLEEMADDPGEADLSGALGQGAGSRNEDDLQDQTQTAPSKGALASGKPKSKYQDIADQLLDYGGGALQQADSIRDAQRAATQEKRTALQRAKENIKDLDRLMPDPTRAWALGLGAPTRTGRFSEAISNAYAMRQQAVDDRRKQIMESAKAMQTLDLAGADLSWREAEAESQGEDRRLRLAEQFNQQARIEQSDRENARIRQEEADNRAKNYAETAAQRTADRESREAIAAENRRSQQEFSTYIGVDKESGLPMFANRLGQTKLGDKPIGAKPGTGRGGTASVFEQKRQAFYDVFKKSGIPDDQAQQMALERATSRAPMSPAERRKLAIQTALEESKGGAYFTPEERQVRTNQIERELADAEKFPSAAPATRKNLAFAPSPSGQGGVGKAGTAPLLASQGAPTQATPAPAAPPQQAAPINKLPPGATPEQARKDAAAGIKAQPAKRAQILQRLQSWGVDISGL